MDSEGPIVALVDDDKIFQLTASKTLQMTGLSNRILQFENGDEALQYLRKNSSVSENLPDCMFLDINMPFVDGWMFLEEFEILKRDLSKTIIIYMVSSSIDPRDIEKARRNPNVKEYVVKPLSRDKFYELLAQRPTS